MPIKELVDKATEKAGTQTRLAEMLGMRQQEISGVRNGKRPISLERRIAMAEIADYDLKVAVLEDIIERLDKKIPVQAELAAQLQAVVNWLPNEGWLKSPDSPGAGRSEFGALLL